jgi:hypothetical protein
MKDTKITGAEFLTLDQLIEDLKALRTAGAPGDTPIVYPTTDNNMQPGFMQRARYVVHGTVARVDMNKGFAVCKAGQRGGGAPVIVLSDS